MTTEPNTSTTRWKYQYDIAFILKYRKKVLYGKLRQDVREIISILCKYKNVDIIAGAVCVDHVHSSVAMPLKISISNFMGYLKGKSTLMIYNRNPKLQSRWDKAVWAGGILCGNHWQYHRWSSTKIYKRADRKIRERRFAKYRFISGPVIMPAIPPFGASSNNDPFEGQNQTTSWVGGCLLVFSFHYAMYWDFFLHLFYLKINSLMYWFIIRHF